MNEAQKQVATNIDTPETQQIAPQAPSPETTSVLSPWLDRLTILGQIRDGFLVFAACCFVLGYITVIVNAYHSNLGFIPPLQPQCILAGVIPVTMIGLVLLFVLVSIRCLDIVVAWVKSPLTQKKRAKRRRPFMYVFFVSTGLMFYVSQFNSSLSIFAKGTPLWMSCVVVVTVFSASFSVCVIMLGSSDKLPEQDDNNQDNTPIEKEDKRTREAATAKAKKGDRVHSIVMLAYMPIMLLWLSAIVWLNVIYPNWPQEFGGMKPRFAYIDIKREDASEETQALLLPPTPPKPQSAIKPAPVVRSQLLDVYYDNGDALFVRQHRASLETPVYQIKKDAIKGVMWGGYTERGLRQITTAGHP